MTVTRTRDHRPRLGHMPGLDGLRGAAVVMVIAYHLGLVPGGFIGVDIFFVLSGFLVTSLLLSEFASNRIVDLTAFWGRRIRRLVPAVLVMVPVALVGALAVGWPPTRLGSTALDGFATLTWWANWRQASGTSYWDAGDPSLFRHAWSLAIEEQFYLLWPLAVVGAVGLGRRIGLPVRAAVGMLALVGFSASAVWSVVLSHRLDVLDLSRVYVGTDTRILAPLAGCALACWRQPQTDRAGSGRLRSGLVAGAGLVGVAVLGAVTVLVSVDEPALYRGGGFTLVALAAVLSVVAAAEGPASLGARLFSGRLPRYLGLRSYGLYLWSWPIQVLIEHRYPTASRGLVVAAVIVASVIVAEVSFRLVEDPIRRGRSWAARDGLRRTGWAFGLALPLVVLMFTTVRAEDPPVHERLDAEDVVSEALDRPPPTTVAPVTVPEDRNATDPDPDPDPDPGPGPGPGPVEPVQVMVMGDSVAFTAVFHRPKEDLPAGIASVDGRAVIGCGQLAALEWEYWSDELGGFAPFNDVCLRRREVEEKGLTGSPDVVLALPGAWEHSAALSPDGEVVEAQSPRMAEVLIESFLDDALRAHQVGASFGLVEWACPGREAEVERRDSEYIRWINGVMAEAAARARTDHGVDAWVLPVTDQVCEAGDPAGEPTRAKDEAFGRQIHLFDQAGGHWIWHAWLGPGLTARQQ